MRIIEPSFRITDFNDVMRNIERGGRVCYKSEDRIEEGSDTRFVGNLLNMRHESCLEHGVISAHFIADRGVSHEFVRHRHTSPSQESTRYCNYAKDKFDNQITVIRPFFFEDCSVNYCLWEQACLEAEKMYMALLAGAAKPQEARSVLPNSLKTEFYVTANAREWRHILKLRTDAAAHPQMRQLMVPFGAELAKRWPVLFGDWAEGMHPSPAINMNDYLDE